MRYRLRTLLILMTIVAAYLGGRASLLPTVREQVKRIDDLEKESAVQRQKINQGYLRLFVCPTSPPVPKSAGNT
jgi:hypothetical protein